MIVDLIAGDIEGGTCVRGGRAEGGWMDMGRGYK